MKRFAVGAALALALAAPALAAGPATLATGGYPTPDQASVTFEHADLRIKVLPDKRRIEGTAALTFRAKAPITTLTLDFDPAFAVGSLKVDGRPLPRAAFANIDGRMRIVLPRAVAAGEVVKAEVVYAGAPHVSKRAPWDPGFVWAKTRDGRPWIATAVQGGGCDLFWPCIDKTTGEIAALDFRITVPKGLTAPANGVLVDTTEEGGWTTFHWRARDVNPYNVAINVGPYGLIESRHLSVYGNTIPLKFWYLKGNEEQAQALFAEFPKILDFFEKYIGPYPLADEKMGVVETPHLGMEHQSINAYGNNYIPGVHGFDWLLHHEFAHEWFGNQLTNADWDDMWLHEGFGSYMQPLYAGHLHGDISYFTYLHGQRLTIQEKHPLVSGAVRAEADVYDPEKGPGGDIYVKGSLLLHTLRELIGDAAFYEAIRRTVYGRSDPQPGNFQPRLVSTPDFIAEVNRATGRDLSWFFDVYLHEAALPELAQERRGDELVLRWRAPGGKPFPMPLEVRVGEQVHRLDMALGEARVSAPVGQIVVIDPGAKVLRRQPHVQAYQAWKKKEQEAKAAKE